MASDAEIEGDLDAFDCDRCEVADALAALEEDPANLRAWRVFQTAVTRFTVDTHTVDRALMVATVDLDAETERDLFERLAVLYDTFHPPPEAKE